MICSCFGTLNHHLNQIVFAIKLEQIDGHGHDDGHDDGFNVELNKDGFIIIAFNDDGGGGGDDRMNRTAIKMSIKSLMNESINLDPLSLRNLKVTTNQLADQLDQLKEYEIGFTVQFDQDTFIQSLSIQLENCLPVQPDLMNDWIFCHHHGHHQEGSNDNQIQSSPSSMVLSSMDQILYILLNSNFGSKILFESIERKNLLIQVLSSESLIGHCNNHQPPSSPSSSPPSSPSSIELSMDLVPSLALNYRHLELGSVDLDLIRRSFETEYYRVHSHLFDSFIHSLLRSTRSVLPIHCRFNPNDNFFYSFIQIREIIK